MLGYKYFAPDNKSGQAPLGLIQKSFWMQ